MTLSPTTIHATIHWQCHQNCYKIAAIQVRRPEHNFLLLLGQRWGRKRDGESLAGEIFVNFLHFSPLFSEGEAEDVVGNFCRESGSSDGWQQGGAGGHHQLVHRLKIKIILIVIKTRWSLDQLWLHQWSPRSISWTSPRRWNWQWSNSCEDSGEEFLQTMWRTLTSECFVLLSIVYSVCWPRKLGWQKKWTSVKGSLIKSYIFRCRNSLKVLRYFTDVFRENTRGHFVFGGISRMLKMGL